MPGSVLGSCHVSAHLTFTTMKKETITLIFNFFSMLPYLQIKFEQGIEETDLSGKTLQAVEAVAA